jgi:hypothetical protein
MRNRGLAILLAIALLAMIGIFIATLSSWGTQVINQQLRQYEDAQLRQLLLASISQAPELLDSSASSQALPLPPDLAQDAAVTLTIKSHTPTTASLVITARLPNRLREVSLTYTRTAGRWQPQTITDNR